MLRRSRGRIMPPAILDRWRPWLALAALLILIAYGPSLAHLIATTPLTSPGFRVW